MKHLLLTLLFIVSTATTSTAAGVVNSRYLNISLNQPYQITLSKYPDVCCLTADIKNSTIPDVVFTDITSTTYTASFVAHKLGTNTIHIYGEPECGSTELLFTLYITIIPENLYYTPCYRFWNQALSSQILLIDESEIAKFREHPEWGWVDEGIKFYVILPESPVCKD